MSQLFASGSQSIMTLRILKSAGLSLFGASLSQTDVEGLEKGMAGRLGCPRSVMLGGRAINAPCHW